MENNQCLNCMKVFKFKSQLDRHILSLRTCKKVIIDDEGNMISEKKFKCNDCNELFSYKRSLESHIKNVCKKHNLITTTSTTSNTEQNISKTINENINRINDNLVNINENITKINDNLSNINDKSPNINDNSTNINDNSTNINDNSTNINNMNIDNSIAIKTYNNNNFALNIGFLNEHLKPTNEFKIIDNNYINIVNIEKYLKIFYKNIDLKNEEKNKSNIDLSTKIESVIAIIKNILLDKYVNNIAIKDRNIMTISSRYKMHYFQNGKWNYDNSYEHFSKNCIEKILSQMDDAIIEKLYMVKKIIAEDISYLKTYDFSINDNQLHSIVQTKTKNIKEKIVDDGVNALHLKILNKRCSIYTNIHNILINPIIKVRVLAIMKDLMCVDNQLREIFGTVPIKTSLPVKEV